MNQDELDVFSSTLNELLQALSLPSAHHADLWLQKKERALDSESNIRIAIMLALNHPRFHIDRLGRHVGNHVVPPHPKLRPNFPDNFAKSYRCGLELLEHTGMCPYTVDNCPTELDHTWPYELGGPSTITNMTELCTKCNQNKANSYWLFPIPEHLDWLEDRINSLYRFKV